MLLLLCYIVAIFQEQLIESATSLSSSKLLCSNAPETIPAAFSAATAARSAHVVDAATAATLAPSKAAVAPGVDAGVAEDSSIVAGDITQPGTWESSTGTLVQRRN